MAALLATCPGNRGMDRVANGQGVYYSRNLVGVGDKQKESGKSAMELARRLLVKTPGGSVSELAIRSGRTVIGRAAACDVVLDSAYVSRTHAALEVRGAAVYVADLKSRNGVLLNGRPLSKERRLSSGDEIRVGDCTLTYVERAAGGETTQLMLGIEASSADDTPLIMIDSEAWEVTVDGVPKKLSLQEFTLLSLLRENAGHVRTREELGNAIWGVDQYDHNMLHQLVHRLKEKIERGPARPQFIESIRGVGYKLRIAPLGQSLP